MPKVTLRFHGRFMYAEDREGLQPPTRKIVAIAPNYDATKAHHPLMAIKHRHVVFIEKDTRKRVTDLDPTFRVTIPDDDENPQMLVWNLAGMTVHYAVPGSQHADLLDNGVKVESVQDLEDNEGRQVALRPGARTPGTGPDSLCRAVVVVTSAEGEPSTEHEIEYVYTKESDLGEPKPVKKQKSKDLLTVLPAELVHFDVRFPAGGAKVPFIRLQLSVTDTLGTTITKTVGVRDGAVVCFSNACAGIEEPPAVDHEFSRYYDLVTAHNKDALIPFDKDGLIEGIPCYQQSRVVYSES